MDELDATDMKILEIMQEDASLPTQEIADRVNMSQSPCWRRISRLIDKGYIKRRVAILDREKLGISVVVFVTVSLSAQSGDGLEEFEEKVKLLPEVIECYTTAGAWDYVLKIYAKDIRHYEKFVRDKLTMLPHIGELHSHIAVTEIKNSTTTPLTD